MHKHADAMVAFNAGEIVGAGRTVLQAKESLSLRYDGGGLGWRDPLMLAEVLRQAVIASVHTLSPPPDGAAFVMERMLLNVTGSATSDELVELHTRDSAPRARAAGSNRIVTTVDFRQGGRSFASGLGHLRVVSRASYERLRGAGACRTGVDLRAQSAAPLELARAGVEPRWRLTFDPQDGFFFDHPVDHVPGMLLFEAVRMAAQEARPGRRLEQFDGNFCRFVELDEVVHVLVDDESPDRLRFDVVGSGDRLAVQGHLDFAADPS